jgi:hypothetical protein
MNLPPNDYELEERQWRGSEDDNGPAVIGWLFFAAVVWALAAVLIVWLW